MSAVTLGSNIASLRAQRRLADGTRSLSRIYERLSSGQRINRAADDAAGLAVSTSLRSDARVFTQGLRNLNDGVSLLNIADGALGELSSITTRLKELAEQAANGSYGLAQRKSLDAEAQALSKEYLRIAQSTTFNGKQLFTGSFGDLRVQAGYGTDGGIQSNLGGAIGTGSFGGATTVSTSSATDVILADVNGDGIVDLIRGSASVKVQLGMGNGTFGAETSYATPIFAYRDTAVGDLNGDGVLDIVTSGAAPSSTINILMGNGDGTFAAVRTFASESTPNKLKLADLDQDGTLDIVTMTNNYLYVRRGKGDGTFSASTSYSFSTGYYDSASSIALGDINGDGIPDLVASGSSGAGDYVHYSRLVTVRLGTGSGTFGTVTTYVDNLLAGTNSDYSVRLGDLNGDGLIDLLTTTFAGEIAVRLGTGGGTLSAATRYSMAGAAPSAVLGDLNGDGILDVVAGSGTTFASRLGLGDGTFSAASSFTAAGATSFALGDVNDDGVLDLATSGTSTVLLGNTTSGVAPLLDFKLTSRADALQALSQFTSVLRRNAAQRGTVGAFQSRVSTAVQTLTNARENFVAAASRITDADVAKESGDLVRTQILQQAASSVLAQANQQPAIALKLLIPSGHDQ